MGIIPDPWDSVNPDELAEMERRLERDADYAVLVKWAVASLPSAEVPCLCADATCLRCQVEFILGRTQAVKSVVVIREEELPF